ncbi:MAG: 4Fe-4S double cluster binding domain-containing protein [Thermoleophilia bacterium]
MTDSEDLTARVTRVARELGAYRVGVASLEDPEVSQAVRMQGDEQLAAFPRAVSIAFRLQDSLVSRLPEDHRVPLVAKTYAFHVYKAVNALLDQTATLVAEALQEAGYAAVSIPTSLSVDTAGFQGPLSHKLPARMAGLGWIGRSCLLVTPGAGPRVRFVTVLTDAPLSAGVPLTRDCGACTLCVEACPAGAFTGRPFDPAEPIEARMDVQACKDYRAEARSESGTDICGVCVAVCPHGRRGRA